MNHVEEVSDKIIKVLKVMEESIEIYTPESEIEIERLNKIKDYIEKTK